MSYTPQFEKEYEGGWEDFPSEDTLITAHSLNMYDGTFEHIEGYLEDHPIAQTTTMPTASEDELGNIYQYMGATDANYTQGYFYKCMDDGEEPPLYFWARINVQPGGGGGGGALEDLDDVNITSPTDGQVLKYDATNDEWVNGDVGGGGGGDAELTNDYWNSATSYVVGDIVIYLNGLYRCIVANTGQTPTNTTYWESITLTDLTKKVYSTDEKIIGKWTDGKPLYQKTFITTSPTTINTNHQLLAIPASAVVHNFFGVLNNKLPVNYWYSNDNNIKTWVNTANTYMIMVVANSENTNLPVEVTLQYTKSTD